MHNLVLIVIGGAIGTIARYGLSGMVYRFVDSSFPYGTLAVNLGGSFLIGFIWGIFESEIIPPPIRNFIFIGLLGGFTTFSSYSLETINLLREGETKLALLNVLSNNIFGILLVFVGLLLAKAIIQSFK